MKRNLFSFPRSQMVGKMLRAMSFVVAVFWATTAMADIVVKGVVADDSGLPIYLSRVRMSLHPKIS